MVRKAVVLSKKNAAMRYFIEFLVALGVNPKNPVGNNLCSLALAGDERRSGRRESVGIVSLRWLIKRGKWPFDVGAHHT